jgi:hypothetical protein
MLILAATVAWPAGWSSAQGSILVDDSDGNGVVSGAVEELTSESTARVTVRNERRFWVALDLQDPTGSMVLTPADLADDAGRVYAGLAVIGPGGEAAYEASFSPTEPGSQDVWVHYDGTTIGGLSAVALNVLQVIAYGLGAGQLSGSADAVLTAARTITDLPDWVAIAQSNQGGAATFADIPEYASVLLGTQAGRQAIRQALSELGVSVRGQQLRILARAMGAAEIVLLVNDLRDAVSDAETQGSVRFSSGGETDEADGAQARDASDGVAWSGDSLGRPWSLRLPTGQNHSDALEREFDSELNAPGLGIPLRFTFVVQAWSGDRSFDLTLLADARSQCLQLGTVGDCAAQLHFYGAAYDPVPIELPVGCGLTDLAGYSEGIGPVVVILVFSVGQDIWTLRTSGHEGETDDLVRELL